MLEILSWLFFFLWCATIISAFVGLVLLLRALVSRKPKKRAGILILVSAILWFAVTLALGGVATVRDADQTHPDASTQEEIDPSAEEPSVKEESTQEEEPSAEEPSPQEEEPSEEEETEIAPSPSPLLSHGFTEDEAAVIEEVLANVGITSYSITDVSNNGGKMDVIRATVNDENKMQFNVTLENRKPIYVYLAGVSKQSSKAKIKWNGKLGTQTYFENISIDLYTDTDGYIAVYSVDKITDYETGEIIYSRN